MAFKSFDAAVAERSDAPTFALHGRTFHCVPELPAKVIFRFVSALDTSTDPASSAETSTGAADVLKLIDAVDDFFRSALINEDYKVWQVWSDGEDSEHIISITTLTDIATWLAGEYSARPTGGSSPSSSSPTSGGGGSTAGASPTAPTYSRPEQPAPIL